jgi:hypothetical protein
VAHLGGGLGDEAWEWREWARAYFAAGREGDRVRLRDGEELASHRWRFAFRPGCMATDAEQRLAHQFLPHFHADGRFEHERVFREPLAWRFIDMPDCGTHIRRAESLAPATLLLA